MNSELKPCPFCGSAFIKKINFGERCEILCFECNAHVHFCTSIEEETISAWNKRGEVSVSE